LFVSFQVFDYKTFTWHNTFYKFFYSINYFNSITFMQAISFSVLVLLKRVIPALFFLLIHLILILFDL
jgi:hypothetical protein